MDKNKPRLILIYICLLISKTLMFLTIFIKKKIPELREIAHTPLC